MAAEERIFGTVKKYFTDKNYGFISREKGEDVFLSGHDVDRAGLGQIQEGETLSFTLKQTPKGWQAINLKREEQPASQTSGQPAASRKLDTHTDFRFTPDYLKDGYFEKKGDKNYLRGELLDERAEDIAKLLYNQDMKSHQLRRFFNQARGIEFRLRRERDFEMVKEQIKGLIPAAVYQVGRPGVAMPEEFKQFIDRNVEWAVQDEESFKRGFLKHFESVLAYFVYYSREDQRRGG